MSHGSPRPTRSNERRGQRIGGRRASSCCRWCTFATPIRASGWLKGECGTIVETFETPDTAYLVEFIDDDGSTKAEATFAADQLSATPATAVTSAEAA